jgi:hypothetical protein
MAAVLAVKKRRRVIPFMPVSSSFFSSLSSAAELSLQPTLDLGRGPDDTQTARTALPF